MQTVSTPLRTEAFIAGEWVGSQRRFSVINPADGKPITEVADCSRQDAAAAANAAVASFQTWRRTTAYERAALLYRFHGLILAQQEALAQLMSREMGKPIRESLGEVAYAAAFVLWYAEEAKRLYGDLIPSAHADKRIQVLTEPVGPVLAITPWNFPAAMVTRKLAPALAAGCSFILKPAEQSPLTALALADLLAQAGLPDGVFQVLPTSDPAAVVDELIADPRIRKLTFTGSTEVGTMLYEKAARTVKRVSLELGGHAPLLVFDDADIECAAEQAVASKFRNAGQTCVCTNRIYVQRGIEREFLEALTRRTRALRVGAPLDPTTDIGPLVNAEALSKVEQHLNDALSRGARVMCGGKRVPDRRGHYFEPTVLCDVREGMRITTEETFGPLAPVLTFETEAEAVTMANNTPFGLAAYLFTTDLSRSARVAEALEYGIVGVNDGVPSTAQAPFGGMKASGIGREGGKYGLEEYLERKYVSVKL